MKGDQVYMHKSGLNTKLSESWAGPFTIVNKNSALSYRVNTRGRTIASVHIQLLKDYISRKTDSSVNRVTMVLEPDTESNSMDQQYTELVLSGVAEAETSDSDVREWEEVYRDTLTKAPGLTRLTKFSIDTGDHTPIAQRPYNTPIALKCSIDREIDWLLEKGYILHIDVEEFGINLDLTSLPIGKIQ